ncbi:MAG: [FeFe] hydrogenase H-cluster radical SAM maturase HydE [Firmicutes bacterium]|nr:[FeFe] hydrogenase H-cluster radical SAM maturase HydE [Bacillota bacterium]
MTKQELVRLLALEDFTPVYEEADRIRRETVGDEVHIRAIIEFSNICARQCRYCGINCTNPNIKYYQMTREEILATAREAIDAGYRTIVLQSGENPSLDREWMGSIVREINGMGATVTLSIGELSDEDFRYYRQQGADRYLLKHETADPDIYAELHPCGTLESRLHSLMAIHDLGYETGSGFMIGLPGQTLETIAEDLLLLKKLNCRMAGIGPFIPHPETPLANEKQGDPELTKRAVALARILIPDANLPVTTALGLVDGRENAFACGANVVMKKVTPDEYKEAYEIYPAMLDKTDIRKDRKLLEEQIRALGRIPV